MNDELSIMARDGPPKFSDLFDIEELPAQRYRLQWEHTFVDRALKRGLYNTVVLLPFFRGLDLPTGGRQDLIVFYGPPGVGKTSLALGLANLFAELERQNGNGSTTLLRARASFWFSEWLGKSAKTVAHAFAGIQLIARRGPVAALINEVETVATDRGKIGAGDPTDVHRFVNAFLNAVDELDHNANVLLLATSNQQELIDRAFIDRAIAVFQVDYPGRAAACAILRDIAGAFRKSGVLIPDGLVHEVVAKLYADPRGHPNLSGRDLRDLFRQTVEECATFRLRPEQVLAVAERLSRSKDHGTA